MSNGGHTRIGHAERDAVVAILREAAAEGRLELDELDERLAVALNAKTYADLDPLVADLPVPPPSQTGQQGQLGHLGQVGHQQLVAQPAMGMARPAGVPVAPGSTPDDPLRLDAGWGSVRRTGAWDLPPFLRLDSALGSVVLDCRLARPLAEIISIECIPGAGSAKIIVPAGWAADLDRLASSWGSAKSKVPTRPAPGMPLLVLNGGVGMSSLTIREQRWYDSEV